MKRLTVRQVIRVRRKLALAAVEQGVFVGRAKGVAMLEVAVDGAF
jgi:hypothetical protein